MAVLSEQERWRDCPDAEVCQSCTCAGEDDVCFPGERLRAENRALVEALRKIAGDYVEGSLNPMQESDGWKLYGEAAKIARVALRAQEPSDG